MKRRGNGESMEMLIARWWWWWAMPIVDQLTLKQIEFNLCARLMCCCNSVCWRYSFLWVLECWNAMQHHDLVSSRQSRSQSMSSPSWSTDDNPRCQHSTEWLHTLSVRPLDASNCTVHQFETKIKCKINTIFCALNLMDDLLDQHRSEYFDEWNLRISTDSNPFDESSISSHSMSIDQHTVHRRHHILQ